MQQTKMTYCTGILITACLFYVWPVAVASSVELLPLQAEDTKTAPGTNASGEAVVKLSKAGDKTKLSIVKRYLRWDSNNIQPMPTGNPFQVRSFKPHPDSERVNANEDYSGFTLYRRNGADIEANTGIFHYVKSSDAEDNSFDCDRPTFHAGAYRYIYGVCPEEDTNLVASGHCHFSGGHLRFNSNTFNSILSYSDRNYYENSDRVMNSIEESIFTKCFNDWKDAGYSLSYTCVVSSSLNVVVSDTKPVIRGEIISTAEEGAVCQDCDNMCSGAQSIVTSFAFVVTLAVLQRAMI